MIPPPPTSTLFPYTTLFRSVLVLDEQNAPVLVDHEGAHGPALLRVQPIVKRGEPPQADRKSTRLNSSHVEISYAVFCLKKKTKSVIKHHITHSFFCLM